MTITELFEFHFHKVELDQSDEEYARWIGCEFQEWQDIRHAVLRVLRVNGFAVRDSISQRIAMYLILAQNRCRTGLGIQLPGSWIRRSPFPIWSRWGKQLGPCWRRITGINLAALSDVQPLLEQVKAIGVCNFYPHVLTNFCETMKIKPMVNQVELHPFFQ